MKLTKLFKVVHKDGKLVFPLTEEGLKGECFPGAGTESAEFDTYAEAKAYVDEHGLVYEEPSFGPSDGSKSELLYSVSA